MMIEGPLKITIADPADGQGRVLVIAFPDEFQALAVTDQTQQLTDYLRSLQTNVLAINDESDLNRQGMLVVQQIVEQLVPFIAEEQIELAETITIQIRTEQESVAITEFLGIDLGKI